MSRFETGRITPQYNGNLSAEMVWNEAVLAGFSKKVDLKTDVVIKEADKTYQASTVNLGEVLAWKKMANPADFFRRSVGKTGVVEVSMGNGGPAEVVINHLMLTEEVTRGGKRFDKQEYLRRFNSSVARGLLHVSAKEKLAFTGLSAKLAGVNLLAVGGFGLWAWFNLSGHVTDFINSFNQLDTQSYILSRVCETVIGVQPLVGGIKYIKFIHDQEQSLLNQHRRWSHSDFNNPLKHVKDFARGNLYMVRHHNDLAQLSK